MGNKLTKAEIADKLYAINSWISGHFVSTIQTISYENVCELNKMLGELIKELRK